MHMKKLLIYAIVLGSAALAAAWYAGVLAPIAFTDKYDGPIYVVYEDHVGPYPLVAQVIKDVTKILDDANVKHGDGIAQYYDDPKTVPADKLRSIGGVIVDGMIQVDSPLAVRMIEYNHYVVAAFKGLPIVGPMVVYPKMEQWMKANNKTLNGPIIEVYKGGFLKTEITYMFPIN
jgi:DNA gyrase inhibitor GyrI